jgi:hypothetical protein
MEVFVLVKKSAIILILTFLLLLSFATLASAEVLFGVTAETGPMDLTTNVKGDYNSYGVYDGMDNISSTPNMVTLTGDLNLFLIHIGAEYGTGDAGHGSTFSTATVKAGWDFGLPVLSFSLFGGYQAMTLTKSDVASTSLDNCAYWDLFAGLGAQASLGPISIYGTTNIPIYGRYRDGVNSDNSASIDYYKLGVSYAPIPFVSLFVDYRKMEADSKVMKLESDGYQFGVCLSF